MVELCARVRPDDVGDRGDAQAIRRVEEVAGKPLPRQGREAAARRRAAARRHEDGQGVHRGEAQDPARRQDGRAPWQQGRRVAHRAAGGHAFPRRRHAGRHRAQSAWRAEPHERRADSRDPSWLGLRRPRQAGRRGGGRLFAHQQHRSFARQAEAGLRRGRDDQGAGRQEPRSSSARTCAAACRSRLRCSMGRARRTSSRC